MKQDAQTNQTKPINNQIKPTGKAHIPFEFRFSRKRELERLKRTIKVERTNLKLPCRERGGRRVCELQLGREARRAQRETVCVRVKDF